MSVDEIIVWGVIGVFVFLLYRKHKKKKQAEKQTTETDGKVQTFELPTGVSSLTALTGNSTLTQYPKGSQVNVYLFNTYNCRDKDSCFHLASEIETKLSREIFNAESRGIIPSFQYMAVGALLVVLCVTPYEVLQE